MKIRALAVSLLAAFSITGCNMLPTGLSTDENAKKIEMVKVTAQEYVEQIDSLNMKLDKTLDNLKEQADLHTKKEPRTTQIAVALKELQNVVSEYRSLQPPEEYSDVQEIFNDAMDSYDEMLTAVRKSLRTQDIEICEKAKEPAEKAEVSLDEANTKLQERITPVEDEDDTVAEQNESDKMVGNVHDAVEENISASGIELVGKWGPEDSIPSIILHIDGRYEGYKNGEYPSYENAMFGTWSYDKSRHIIQLEIEEVFADGEKKKNPPDNVMELTVEKFQDSAILLVDSTSHVKFDYVKYDDDPLDSELPSGKPSSVDDLTAEDEPATEDETDYEALTKSKWTREDGIWTEFIQFYDFGTVIVTRFNNETRESTSWYGDFTFDNESGTITGDVVESNEPSINLGEIVFKLLSVNDEELELKWNNERLVFEVNKPFKVDEEFDEGTEVF